MPKQATSFEVVRIEPVDVNLPDDTHNRKVEECRVSWRSEHTYDSPQEACQHIDGFVHRDKREGRADLGFYVVVAEGGNPLRDPSCMVLLTHPRSILALPF